MTTQCREHRYPHASVGICKKKLVGEPDRLLTEYEIRTVGIFYIRIADSSLCCEKVKLCARIFLNKLVIAFVVRNEEP